MSIRIIKNNWDVAKPFGYRVTFKSLSSVDYSFMPTMFSLFTVFGHQVYKIKYVPTNYSDKSFRILCEQRWGARFCCRRPYARFARMLQKSTMIVVSQNRHHGRRQAEWQCRKARWGLRRGLARPRAKMASGAASGSARTTGWCTVVSTDSRLPSLLPLRP